MMCDHSEFTLIEVKFSEVISQIHALCTQERQATEREKVISTEKIQKKNIHNYINCTHENNTID